MNAAPSAPTRNGYRARDWDTRAGTIEVAIPKLRTGSYFPDSLLERRRRAEAALVTVVATSYLLGVSTRRMEQLVATLGIDRLCRSQVSQMARHLDAQVEAFRTRPLDAGPYRFVAADALVVKVREDGRTVNVHALLAVGVNAEGYREILGLQVASAGDGAGWLAFFRDMVARGLSGVALVTSDARHGLVALVVDRVQQRLRPGPGRPGGETPEGRGTPGHRPARHPHLHRLPQGRVAPDLVQQPAGATQPGDPPPHRPPIPPPPATPRRTRFLRRSPPPKITTKITR